MKSFFFYWRKKIKTKGNPGINFFHFFFEEFFFAKLWEI